MLIETKFIESILVKGRIIDILELVRAKILTVQVRLIRLYPE